MKWSQTQTFFVLLVEVCVQMRHLYIWVKKNCWSYSCLYVMPRKTDSREEVHSVNTGNTRVPLESRSLLSLFQAAQRHRSSHG